MKIMSCPLNGPRNIIAFSAFYSKATALDGAILPPTVLSNDTRQFGAGVDLSRTLSDDTTGLLSFNWKNVYGLGSRSGEFSRQKGLQLGFNKNVTPRSTLTYGLRRNVIRSTTQPEPGNETAAFAGYATRF